MNVTTRDGTIRAVDEAKTSLEVGAPGWTPVRDSPPLSRSVDAAVGGRVARLEFPPAGVVVAALDTDRNFELGSGEGPLDLPHGKYVMRVEAPVKAYVRFDGPATISRPGYERTLLSLPSARPVTVGFRSRAESPPGTVVVPRTPAGVATALSQFPAGHRTTSPDRSFPTMRGHPPLVRFGDTTSIPAEVRDERPDTRVSLSLPADLSYLYPAAPLAHYLGAEVTVADGATPELRVAGERHPLDPTRYEQAVADLLQRTFWLDCLVRNVGPHGTELTELDLLDRLDLDADAAYAAEMADRLRMYLDADFGAIVDDLPEWHLSMYADPTYDTLAVLPHLLHNVPLIFSPSARTLEGRDRLSSSLDDFYRASTDAPSVDLVEPELGPSRYHGWLAEGIPIDVFKTLPEAYDNRRHYRERADEPISVVAVLNDSQMGEEYAEAARIYRERATELDIDIDIRENLTVAELARTFETPNDLVHFIGHCEESGLRCPDGNLSVSSLSESRAQTFFLNACGSYYEGADLVRKGSVAGAVTFARVLDRDAARVGTMFARLLVHGYSLERALDLSRRRVIMSKDYAVVGDGTHVLAQTSNVVGPEAWLERRDDGRFDLLYSVGDAWITGGNFQVHLDAADRSSLMGTRREFTLDRATLIDFLDHADVPVVYAGDIQWSDELARELRTKK